MGHRSIFTIAFSGSECVYLGNVSVADTSPVIKPRAWGRHLQMSYVAD